MPLISVNPATGEQFAQLQELDAQSFSPILEKSQKAFENWRKLSFRERGVFFKKLAENLRLKIESHAEIISKEIGKPIRQARAEIEKCAWVCEFYSENTENCMAEEVIKTDASFSAVRFEPLGVILAIMPWNFPFWQVLRAAAPIIMSGNTMILKHASNVSQSALAIEAGFLEAGFPESVFQFLPIRSEKISVVLENPIVRAVTLTGSESAGKKVAEICGKLIKKCVLELGGSDPFIVLADADLEITAEAAVLARFQNCGQSCIAGKRFIVLESVYEKFIALFAEKLATKKVGNPLNEATDIGPVAGEKFLEELEKQVNSSLKAGARLVVGGKRLQLEDSRFRSGSFFAPTILADVTKGMSVYEEETFGPVASVIKVKDLSEAINVANDTKYGLGATIWTSPSRGGEALALSEELECGSFFVNGIVKSDPRLPFGGAKNSGLGRELGVWGVREFVNVKTVWLK